MLVSACVSVFTIVVEVSQTAKVAFLKTLPDSFGAVSGRFIQQILLYQTTGVSISPAHGKFAIPNVIFDCVQIVRSPLRTAHLDVHCVLVGSQGFFKTVSPF